MQAKTTYVNGYKFRSLCEARWSYFLNTFGLKWEYEPNRITFCDGSSYLPDFYLPQEGCYIEIKARPMTDDEKRILALVATATERPVIALCGYPRWKPERGSCDIKPETVWAIRQFDVNVFSHLYYPPHSDFIRWCSSSLSEWLKEQSHALDDWTFDEKTAKAKVEIADEEFLRDHGYHNPYFQYGPVHNGLDLWFDDEYDMGLYFEDYYCLQADYPRVMFDVGEEAHRLIK